MEYKKEPAFINRQEEISYLKDWIEQRPEHILFFYGPKSSGKTTLIYKFTEGFLSDESKFSVKLFNLREVLIVSYEDFLQRFFTVDDPQKKDSTQTRQYNLKVFKLTLQTRQKIKDRQLDPFDVMKAELKELNAKGIKASFISRFTLLSPCISFPIMKLPPGTRHALSLQDLRAFYVESFAGPLLG